MTPAHTQMMHITIARHIPAHLPRADEPTYKYFNDARERLKKAGKLVCWRCGAKDHSCGGDGTIAMHHDLCEYCLIAGIDIEKVKHLMPELHIEKDEDFYIACESAGGLLALCENCHIGAEGTHFIPAPDWTPGRYKRDGIPPFAVVVRNHQPKGSGSSG